MALAGLADLHRNLPIRIGVAAAVLVSLGGIATLMVPETICMLGGSARTCGAAAVATPVSPAGTEVEAVISPVPAAVTSREPSPATPARPPPPAVAAQHAGGVAASVEEPSAATPPVTQPASTPAAAGLIDTTFKLLDATTRKLEARGAAVPTVAARDDAASEPTRDAGSAGPVIRHVRTTPVRADIATGALTYGAGGAAPDGPATDDVALAEEGLPVASAPSAPETSPAIEETASASAAPRGVPVPAPAPEALRAKAQAGGKASATPVNVMVVAGQGANVRASPASSASKLFAIRGGEKVTVLKRSRGWNEIADSRGRHGWIWSRMLVRPNG